MRRRWTLIACTLVAVAVPLAAQQPVNGSADDQRLKFQIQTFEAVLQSAVKHGADTFAQQVPPMPGVQLTSNDPEVKGFAPPTPDGGLLFVVIVPEIREMVVLSWMQQRSPGGSIGPARPNSGRVGAMTVTDSDPMSKSPVVPPPADSSPAAFDPSKADTLYTKSVVEALKDAMLDHSAGLLLKETEWLTIAAIDAVGPMPGIVNNPFGQTTYLSIKGSDLLQLRQGKITRDEARELIHLKQR